MMGPELTFLEAAGGRSSGNDKHLSTVLAHGRPALTADVDLAGALTRAVLGIDALQAEAGEVAK